MFDCDTIYGMIINEVDVSEIDYINFAVISNFNNDLKKFSIVNLFLITLFYKFYFSCNLISNFII